MKYEFTIINSNFDRLNDPIAVTLPSLLTFVRKNGTPLTSTRPYVFLTVKGQVGDGLLTRLQVLASRAPQCACRVCGRAAMGAQCPGTLKHALEARGARGPRAGEHPGGRRQVDQRAPHQIRPVLLSARRELHGGRPHVRLDSPFSFLKGQVRIATIASKVVK